MLAKNNSIYLTHLHEQDRVLSADRVVFAGQFHQHVYTQLLGQQIQKAQKAAWIDCLFLLLRSAPIKAARKMLAKLTPVHGRADLSSWGKFKSNASAKRSHTIAGSIENSVCKVTKIILFINMENYNRTPRVNILDSLTKCYYKINLNFQFVALKRPSLAISHLPGPSAPWISQCTRTKWVFFLNKSTSVAWFKDPLERCSSSSKIWDLEIVTAAVQGSIPCILLRASGLRPRTSQADDVKVGVERTETNSGLVGSQISFIL